MKPEGEKLRSNYPADNTGRNVRKRDTTELTPKDQSNDATDLQITQDVRKKVMDDSALSMNAKNVKIITQGRVVTLKGSVKDDAERQNVLEKARSVATVNRVDDQLDVENK